MWKAFASIGNVIYTAIVIAVLAFALLFVGTKIDVFGYEVKVVQSGSMEPAVATGGIVVIAPANEYRIGDIVTYGSGSRNSIPVTHRVVERAGAGPSATYLTKGDANEDADALAVPHREVIGKVVFSLPFAGYVIDFARTPWGFALLIGLPALLIILDEFANIMWEIHKYRFRKRQGKVGYRTPARDRRPRDHGRPRPGPLPPQKKARPAPPAADGVLDLRHYRFDRRSI